MQRLRAAAVAGVIPWIPAVPPPAAPPSLAAPCRPASLRADLQLQGATGSLAGAILLTNRGRRPCSLLGRPQARFLDGSDPSGVRQGTLRPESQEPGLSYPSLRALRTGESAAVLVWWNNWCGTPRPTRLALRLAGDEYDLPVAGSARCDVPSAASTLSLGPLQPRAPRPQPYRLPLAAAIVEQMHLGPKTIPGVHGRRGRTAVFHISLTNTSPRPFRFGTTCPTYAEGTGLDQPVELHVLNCRPVGSIRPQQSVVFEMRIRVPSTAPLGRVPLTWTLAPATELPPFVGGVIVVRR